MAHDLATAVSAVLVQAGDRPTHGVVEALAAVKTGSSLPQQQHETLQRNFQAVLHALERGALLTEPLISHRFDIEDAAEAYELLSSPEPSLMLCKLCSNKKC